MAIQPWGKNSFRDRLITTLLFIGFGALTLIVFSPWRPLLEKTDDYLGRMILIVFLLITAYLFKRHERYQQYTKLTIGLIILAVAGSLDYIFAIYITRYLGLTDVAPMGWALQKLNEFAVVVSVVIFLNYATGDSLSSLYIKKGKLRMGLTIGFVLFFAAAAGSIPMANLFYGNDLTMERIIPWLPWILIFVLANGAMEEVLFRGLFLGRLEPFFGRFGANIMVAVVFTLIHGAVTYTVDNYFFLAVLFPLALAWGYIMQKTDSIWGSILFHAGMDIPIILGVFSNL